MNKEKPFYYGGQALMGGVMIRGRNSMAIAVRKMDGSIDVSNRPLATLYKGKWREVPFIRGVIALIEAVVLGTGALMYSAQVSTETEQEKITPGMIWGSVILGVVLAVALFFVLPLLAARVLDPFISSAFISNLVEGLIRIIFFIVYLALIGRVKDIREIFAYHGAEHMSVNAYEAGVPLDVSPVRHYPTTHTRCGTSFLLVVLVISIIVFALLGRPNIWISIATRILMLPVIAAVSYELIKFEAAYSHNRFIHWMLLPGLWLQAMTTRQPSDSQLEVAITAMKKALETDGVTVPVVQAA
ncbi:MAG: DUF1385 domain-containing protein, partial [Chloroflexi bacterium]|nr:DUF1385 domain-containing protein [Chloroflexota bacterium]